MLNRKLPWSLMGVSDAARDEARRAAKEAGVPIGDWLAETIRRVSASELERTERKREPSGETRPAAAAAPPSDRADAGRTAIESITPPPEAVAGASATMTELCRRLDEVEQRATDRLEPLAAAIDRMTIRLDELDERLRRIEMDRI